MTPAPAFWRFLPGGPPLGASELRHAASSGKGSFARALRDARARLGSRRAASLLRTIETPPGVPFTLVVAAAFQAKAIEDALKLAFAIAGLVATVRTIDGFAVLEQGAARDPAILRDADMILLTLLPGSPVAPVARIAEAIGEQCVAPVLLAGFEPLDPSSNSFDSLVVVGVEPVVDERFAASFGTIPTDAAADRLANAVAGRAARLKGEAPKLLVTDLDGTLWSGTLGEDGIGVLHGAYAGALRTLSDHGLVLAIASRNDPGDVGETFAANPNWPVGERVFSARAIGWEPKHELVARVLERLSLAPEHMVFVDDDAANCAQVAARFPGADVRRFVGDPEAFALALAGDPLLRDAGGVGAKRRDLYRRREAVEQLRARTADTTDFMRRLDTRLTAVRLSPSLVPRAAELAIRVNQFAMNGWRPSAHALSERASPLDFMLRLDDAFGSHGLVGLVLAHANNGTVVVESVFLSCRALGRGIENAMLHALAERARGIGCVSMQGRLETLARNEPARRHFSPYSDGAGSWTVRLDADPFETPEGVTLRWETTTG